MAWYEQPFDDGFTYTFRGVVPMYIKLCVRALLSATGAPYSAVGYIHQSEY